MCSLERLGRHRLELGRAHDRPVQRLQFVVARVRAQLAEAGAVDRGLHDLAVEAVRRAHLVAREDLGFVPPERRAREVAHGLGEGLPLVALRARRAVVVRALVLDLRVLAHGGLEALGLSARVADDVVPQRVRRERRLRQVGGLRGRQQPAHALAGSREVHRHRLPPDWNLVLGWTLVGAAQIRDARLSRSCSAGGRPRRSVGTSLPQVRRSTDRPCRARRRAFAASEPSRRATWPRAGPDSCTALRHARTTLSGSPLFFDAGERRALAADRSVERLVVHARRRRRAGGHLASRRERATRWPHS